MSRVVYFTPSPAAEVHLYLCPSIYIQPSFKNVLVDFLRPFFFGSYPSQAVLKRDMCRYCTVPNPYRTVRYCTVPGGGDKSTELNSSMFFFTSEGISAATDLNMLIEVHETYLNRIHDRYGMTQKFF